MPEQLQIRTYGNPPLPALVYLPGLHGDWTLIGGFRAAVLSRVRFVEVTYPRTLHWSLDQYAAAAENALHECGIHSGWLLGESFGSQVVWKLIERNRFQCNGIVLAGGFARHPMRWAARMAERVGGALPLSLVTRVLFGYAIVARFRFRRSPETFAGIREFIDRRTEQDRLAAVHRLRLVAANDPRHIAQNVQTPVFGLTGALDPVVPWIAARSWLRRHCPALRDYRIVWSADHNVLGTAPQVAAAQVLMWMKIPPSA